MSIIRDARKLYDMYAILGFDPSKKTFVCPLPMHAHQNYTPSFSIFTKQPDGVQYFRCHGSCGAIGDSVDLTGFMKIPYYDPKDPEMVKRAITLLQNGFQISPPQVARARVERLPYDAITRMDEPDLDVLAYADERGLSQETLERYMVRKYEAHGKKFMAIPTFHFGTLMSIKLRNINARTERDRFQFYPGSMTGLFNYGDVFGNSAPVLIVKAEIPALILLQHGIHVCAPSGSENVNQKELFQAVAWSAKRVVVKDNDKRPEVREKMDEYAVTRAKLFQAALVAPPEEFKDIDEFVLARGELALEKIREWLR